MRITVIYIFLIFAIAALALGCAGIIPAWGAIAGGGVTVITLFLLARYLIIPQRVVLSGIDLLKSGETSHRLAHAGQPEADRIADLFNGMMTNLRNERLKLKEKERLLGYLIEASPMGVVIMDFDSRLTEANSAFLNMAGLNGESEWGGKRLNEIDSTLTHFASRLGKGEQALLRLPDGSTLKCSALTFMESGFERPFMIVENVTREIDEARRDAYGQVIRIISHEVNNSMCGMRSLLEMLASLHENEPELHRLIGSVDSRCESLSDFIRGYADVIRMPAPELRPLYLSKFISDSLPFLEGMCRSAITFRNNIPPNGERTVKADSTMLSQVLVNIVKNADESIAASPDAGRGRIDISISMEKKGPKLTVADNGNGIPENVANNIFTPFYSSKPGGQGIGLTLVSEILRRHGCTFSLLTESDGITRFRISFCQAHSDI